MSQLIYRNKNASLKSVELCKKYALQHWMTQVDGKRSAI